MIAIISAIMGLSAAAVIIQLIRSDRLHVNHGLGWFLVAATLSLLGVAPSLFDFIAAQVGVSYPPALAFSLGFLILIVKLLLNDIDRSRMQIRQQRIIQRLAILESELRRLRDEQTPKDLSASYKIETNQDPLEPKNRNIA